MLDLAKLIADVTEQKTVIASVLTLIEGMRSSIESLKTQLAAAIAANDPAQLAAAQTAIDTLEAQLAANNALLATAVPANTPAADPAPPVAPAA